MAKKINYNLIKIGRIYYFKKQVDGKLIKKSLGPNVEKARETRDKYVENLRLYGSIYEPNSHTSDHEDKKDGSDAEKPLYSDVQERYLNSNADISELSRNTYDKVINRYINPFFGQTPINLIDYQTVSDFIGELKELAPKTRANILTPLRSTFKYAKLCNIIDEDFMPMFRNKKSKTKDVLPFSREDVYTLLEHTEPSYQPYFAMMAFSGMRVTESQALKWDNVDLIKCVIKIRERRIDGKDGKVKTPGAIRDIEMEPEVIEAFKWQEKLTFGRSKYAFINSFGRPLNSSNVNKFYFKPACRRAGLMVRPLKHMRHTFATIMLDEGRTMSWVRAQLGHGTIQMIVQHYYDGGQRA